MHLGASKVESIEPIHYEAVCIDDVQHNYVYSST